MPDHTDSSITVLILAGGQATRMGGTDKGLLECAGRPLIEHVLTRVASCAERILISANRHLEAYRRYGYPVLTDTAQDFPGPLAGIARGLESCTTEWLWVVPCDAPLVEARLLVRLLETCRRLNAPAAVPVEDHQVHPTFALLRRDTLASLHRYLEQRNHAVRHWLETLPAHHVDCTDHPDWFVNVNTPDELTACAARMKDIA